VSLVRSTEELLE